MKIVVNKQNRSLNDLTRSLFTFEGKRAADDQKRAADALLAANPQLNDAKRVAAGMTVIVPDVEGVNQAASAATETGLGQELLVRLETALKLAEASVKDDLAKQETDLEATQRQLAAHAREFAAAGPEAAERLGTLAKMFADQKAALATEGKDRQAGLDEIRAALPSFRQMVSGTTPDR